MCASACTPWGGASKLKSLVTAAYIRSSHSWQHNFERPITAPTNLTADCCSHPIITELATRFWLPPKTQYHNPYKLSHVIPPILQCKDHTNSLANRPGHRHGGPNFHRG